MKTTQANPMGNPWWGLLPVVGYLGLMYVVPLSYLVLASFRQTQGSGLEFTPVWTLDHYEEFLGSASSGMTYLRSLGIALATVGVSILLGYPMAYTLTFIVPKTRRRILLFLMVAPFWTSFVIRAFAWQLLLADRGLLNAGLERLGFRAVKILYTPTATLCGLAVFGTMLMTLNLYSVMESIHPHWLAAAADLGARRWQAFWQVIVPLSIPGLGIGSVLTFILAFGDYVVPSLLGGGMQTVLSQAMVGAITTNFNIPRAATYAVVMLVTMMAVTLPVLKLSRTAQSRN